jgi:hypothetical protein
MILNGADQAAEIPVGLEQEQAGRGAGRVNRATSDVPINSAGAGHD